MNLSLPRIVEGKNDKETINNLIDTVAMLRKEIEFFAQNIDEENILQFMSANKRTLLFNRLGIMQSWGDSIVDNVGAGAS